MNNLQAAPGATKRRLLAVAVVVAALLAGLGVGLMLPDSTTQLDAAHEQVESLTTRTELLSAELEGARTDNTSLTDLFEETEAEVRSLGKDLAAARKRGDAREAKLDQRGKALDQQEKDLEQREKALAEGKKDVAQREDALDQQKKALAQQDQDLDQREKALDQREAALDQREKALDQQAAAAANGTRGGR